MKKKIWEAAVMVLLVLSVTLNLILLCFCLGLKKQNTQLSGEISAIPQQVDASLQTALARIDALQNESQSITSYFSIDFGALEKGRYKGTFCPEGNGGRKYCPRRMV